MEINKHIVQNLLSKVCFLASSLLLNIFFSRLLSADGSGNLYYSINNYAVITLFASLSFESGMTYFLSKKEIEGSELFSFTLIWTLLAACITTLIMQYFSGSFFFPRQYNTTFYSFSFIAGTLLTSYFSALFFAQRDFLSPFFIPAFINVLLLSYGYFGLFTKSTTHDHEFLVRLYFASIIMAGVVLGIVYYLKYLSSVKFFLPTIQTLKKLLRYTSLAFVANITAFFAYRIDYWILKGFIPGKVSENDLGNYIQVAKLVQLFLFVPTVVATVVFPAAASQTGSFVMASFKKMIRNVVLLNLLGCIVLFIAGRWLFLFLFGVSFSAMYQCFVFSVPAILAISVVRVLASWFAGTNRIRYNLVGGLLALILVSSFNFLLIPSMGINGAALADSIGYIGYLTFLVFSFVKINRKVV